MEHKSMTLWLTGLSGSGKTTIAKALQKTLHDKNIFSYIIDGDEIRKGLNKNLGFSPEDRTENIRRIAELCKILRQCNVINIVSVISPYRKDRKFAKSLGKDILEVFVDCPLEVCVNRDVKGLYKKAKAGKIKQFTGISAVYEEPLKPDVHLKTDKMSIKDCVNKLLLKIGPIGDKL